MMRVKSKTPQIRFKGFSEEWEEEELQKYYPKIRNGFVGTATPFYREKGILYLQGKNVKNGLIVNNGYIYISSEFNEKQIKSQLFENDIIMVQSGHVGECALITKEYVNSNCHALLVLTPNENVHSKYVVYYFYTNYGKKIIQHIKTGSTIEHILSTDLKTVLLSFPSFVEQTKIGNYFQNLDKLIDQKEQKYQKLRQFKTAMLSKMFPQNGAATPEIRFKGFSGEWEEKKLGNIATFTKGKGISKADIVDDGKTLCIRYGELYTSYSEVITAVHSKTNSNTDMVYSEDNDILMPTSDVTPNGLATASALSQSGIILGGDILIIRSEKIVNHFFSYFVKGHKNKIIKLVSGTTVFHLYAKDIENLYLHLPQKEEQIKIGIYFQKIDTLIDLHAQELDKLRHIKKASLEKMFV